MKRVSSHGYLLLIIFFGVLPLLNMFGTSFLDADGFTLRHYSILFDWDTIRLLGNTVSLGLLTVAGTLLLGIPLSYILTRTTIRFNHLFFLLFLVPLFLPPYILAVSWRTLLAHNGFAEKWFGIGELTASFLDSLWGCAFVLVMSYLPVAILFLSNAFRHINPSTEEAARLEGSEFHVIRFITLSNILPAILSSSLLVFLLSISEFGVPMILGVHVFTGEIFTQFAAFYNEKTAIALSLPFIVITLLLILWERKLLKANSTDEEDAVSLQAKHHDLGIWNIPTIIVCSLIILISIGLPLGVVVFQISTDAFLRALTITERPLGISLSTAIISATILSLLGLGVGYAIERGKNQIINIATMLLFAVPATIVGIGLIKFWNISILSGIVYNTPVIIIIGYIIRFLIFSERIFFSSLTQIPRSFEESARVEGASQLQLVIYIVWPLLRPAFVAAWILTFILCFGELATTIIVYPAGGATLPISLYTIMANSPESLTAAISLLLVLPILGAVGISFSLAQRMQILTIHR
jgi:iron(III) transport system permease protein